VGVGVEVVASDLVVESSAGAVVVASVAASIVAVAAVEEVVAGVLVAEICRIASVSVGHVSTVRVVSTLTTFFAGTVTGGMPPVVVVYWHDVDPRPEQAFAHVYPTYVVVGTTVTDPHLQLSARDNAFFEVRARIDGIKTALEGAGQDQFELRRVGGTDGGDDAHRNDVLAQVRRVHADGYVHWLANVYESAQRPVVADTFPPSVYGARYPRKAPMQMLAGYWCFDSWTPVVKDTYEAALLSAECAIRAARAIGPNTPLTYALCRPPGHHASARRFGGYCYLNNAAIAARVLQQQQDNSGDNAPMRVAILDVDYHHGNGTQDIFYEDPSVFYASLHGDPETGGEPFYVG